MTDVEIPDELYESAKSYLMRADENGDSLYDHLSNLISRLLTEHPSRIESLEDFSRIVREDEFRYQEKDPKRFWKKSKPDERIIARANEIKNLYKPIKIKKPTPATTKVSKKKKKSASDAENRFAPSGDILEQARYFEMAGIALPQNELYQISLAMQRLAAEKTLRSVRFWGKIFGTQSNYIICESEYVEQDPQQQQQQQPGEIPAEFARTGANRNSYWVCAYPGAKWNLLPDVTPRQITVARQIKKFFTGDLTRPLHWSYPSFPGTEANYLRAQIARITFSTTISPTGYYKEPEEQEEEEEEGRDEAAAALKKLLKPDIELNPEFAEIDNKDLKNLENWVHHYPNIRKEGRVHKYVPPKEKKGEDEDEDNGDADGGDGDSEEDNDSIALLRSLTEDQVFNVIKPPKIKAPKGADSEEAEEGAEEEEEAEEGADIKKIPAWKAYLCNELMGSSHACVIMKSLRWPGAFTFGTEKGRKFGSIYVGHGHKSEPGAFTPTLPPALAAESEAPKEIEEPTFMMEKKLLAGEELGDDKDAGDDEDAEGEGEGDEDDE